MGNARRRYCGEVVQDLRLRLVVGRHSAGKVDAYVNLKPVVFKPGKEETESPERDYGEHLGLPRLLDMGQCNNAYGAIKVAVALSEAFDCTVNDLPLTLVVSWFEQKAVAVLLTLLHLGVKGITIGPKPPGFVTPNVFKILQEKFDLRLTGDSAQKDLDLVLAVAG